MVQQHPRPTGASIGVRARRGIGIIRVSKEREGGTSPEVQRHAIQTYAQSRNIEIIEWVEGVDEAKYSGSRRNSKWWAKLDYAIEHVERGRADVIVGWKFSRTARNRLRWAVALDRIDVAGGSLESATEQTDATPSGRFARGMLGEMNAYQAELIGETWREAHDRRRRHGLPHDGHPRYGYDLIDGRYQPSPVEGPILAEMYRRIVEGYGFESVAKWANQQGHLTKRGHEWSRVTVTNALDTGFGAGLIVQRAMTGQRRDRNPLHSTYHPGAHDAVITPDIWEAYLARRAEHGDGSRSTTRRMLSGLVRCGSCGAPMYANAGGTGAPYYSCSRATVNGTRKVSIRISLLEQAVTDWLFNIPIDADAAQKVAEKRRRARVTQIEDHNAIQRLIERNQERTVNLTIRHLDGKIPDSAYTITLAKLEEEATALEARLTQATRPLPSADVRAAVPRFREGWATTPADAQNRLLRTLVARVVVDPAPRPGTGTSPERIHIIPAWDS